ncbi:T9SS type A sorting domain-containing protein [Marixanthomonas spongiae]|uniref:T9SS C-terminal target domain-containing protein n=1 Tax=Marixanthomonas spongiae TaxID=2174845 RepID=A0A2U0I3H6_9FLAO|nr:YCF48-related protein [Marixanthomonas spongiae]PVW15614.1 hypothetical protein DDV96_04920 [Marixanthomonas spongiae]
MKTITLIFTLCISLFSVSMYAQDWEPLNTNTTARIYDMSFPAGQNEVGYAATGSGLFEGEGTIIKTIDGGDSWSQIYPASGTADILRSIFFTSVDVGYAGGLNDILMKTTDGGATWTDISPSTAGDFFQTIVFFDDDNGIAAANPEGVASTKIYVTDDAGANWQEATGLIHAAYDVSYVSDVNTLIAAGQPNQRISKSTDGGLTWTVVNTGLPTKLLLGVDFAGDYGVAVGSNGDTYITNDAGDTWERNLLQESGNFQGIHVFDSERTIIGGSNEKMFMTTDGGMNWELEYDGPNTEFFYDIEFTDNNTGFAGLSSGVILRKAAPLSIGESNIDSEFVIYPNPTTGVLTVSSKTSIVQIEIYNQLGQVLQSSSNENTIDITKLNSGIYLAKIKDDNGNTASKKIVKQ